MTGTSSQFWERPFQKQKEWFRIILLSQADGRLWLQTFSGGPRDVNTFFFGVFLVGYKAVAVVKASADESLTWNNLQGKKSCHTAVERTAGWNIPMGLLYSRINHCEFGKWILGGCCDQSQAGKRCSGKRVVWNKMLCPWFFSSKFWLKWTSRRYLKEMVKLGSWIRMVLFGCIYGFSWYMFTFISHEKDQVSSPRLIWSLEA